MSTDQTTGPATEEAMETQAPATPAAEAPETKKKGKGTSFDLIPDSKAALLHGGLYIIYVAVALVLAAKSDPETQKGWFYLFYFLACFLTFQGFTIVGRQCMHMTPKAVVGVDISGRKITLRRKNGGFSELTLDIDYRASGKSVTIQGQTHDRQKVNEVIRKGALPEGQFEELLKALKKFR